MTPHATMKSALSLDDAVSQYMGSTDMAPHTRRGYAAVLRELAVAHPTTDLQEFEPPEGTERLAQILEARRGTRAPRTYNKSLSVLRSFFAWHTSAGNLEADPAEGMERKPVEQMSRNAISAGERDMIFRANPAPFDAVPLRLLLDVGVPKGTLTQLRFADFDVDQRTVSFERGGRRNVLPIEDVAFWTDLAELRRRRCSADDDYVVPKEISRKYNPTPAEIEAMKVDGALDNGTSYLWKRPGSPWERATIVPNKSREYHGTHLWWYRCVQRAGLVAPGVTSGFPMMSARYTVGRRVLAETGRVRAVMKQLGVGSGGFTGTIYSNRDADQLETTIRRVKRQLRQPSSPSGEEWWRGPVARLVDHIDEERGLVELSRVSIEVLRTQDESSPALRDAAETLTRVVKGSELVRRAQRESRGDHPLLHGHSVVAIWGTLETMVLEIASAWVRHWPAARARAEIAEMKVPFGLFDSMSPDERAEALVQELDRQPARKKGIDRFETLLDVVGLSGAHDRVLAQNIYEMQQMRHVYAHRQGVADRRFTDSCPHLGYSVGQPILIDRQAWSDIMVNALLYGELVLHRMKHQFSIPSKAPSAVVQPIRHTVPAKRMRH